MDQPSHSGDERQVCSMALNRSKGKTMIRNLKALGLALVAILAMSAVAASAASAQGKLTSDGSVTLRGSITPATQNPETNALTAFGAVTHCENVLYTGHKLTETPHKILPVPATQVTITPHYGTCRSEAFGISFPTTVDMNGCDYQFNLGATTGGVAHTYGVSAFVKCPAGADIVVTVFTPSSEHLSPGEAFCQNKITEKTTAYTGLHATDLTNGHIRIQGTVGGIEAHKQDAPHPNGFFPCPPETTANAILDLDITVEGRAADGVTKTPISLSH
jgi:hypothetical protein